MLPYFKHSLNFIRLKGDAEREDGPATTKLGKTAQEPRAATEGCPYTQPGIGLA